MLARIRPPRIGSDGTSPPPLINVYDDDFQSVIALYKQAPISLNETGAFLEELFDEQFEATFDRMANANDYEYVADTLSEETELLNPTPAIVVRALTWLKEQGELLKVTSHSLPDDIVPTVPDSSPQEVSLVTEPVELAVNTTVKLELRQVALLYIYQGKVIPPAPAADAIAKEYGHKSGKRLYDKARELRNPTDRTGVSAPARPKMIKDITAVIPLLTGIAQQTAKGELKQLTKQKE
ncbi:hypothetical protein [Hymenobacter nivis]|uniref:hypothetical protein n=1 Tax=Hymenobacter nivis TaxID=1850093 RepID=UPI00112E2995|nr:hypothetical protein [Hymenobacter nivis]